MRKPGILEELSKPVYMDIVQIDRDMLQRVGVTFQKPFQHCIAKMTDTRDIWLSRINFLK